MSLTISCGSAPEVSNVNKAPVPTVKPTPTELEISGEYKVTGSNENSGQPYEGTMTITNQEDAYRFFWHTTRPRPAGVGVQIGDAVAVSYADAAAGKPCGVALYKIAADGSLTGKVAHWGEYKFASEKAVRVKGDNFDGEYKLTGTSADGTPYEGTIEVEKNGSGHQFTWHLGKVNLAGFGIWRADRAAISFGGPECGFALYQIQSTRLLEGRWGGQRTVAFGSETAKRD